MQKKGRRETRCGPKEHQESTVGNDGQRGLLRGNKQVTLYIRLSLRDRKLCTDCKGGQYDCLYPTSFSSQPHPATRSVQVNVTTELRDGIARTNNWPQHYESKQVVAQNKDSASVGAQRRRVCGCDQHSNKEIQHVLATSSDGEVQMPAPFNCDAAKSDRSTIPAPCPRPRVGSFLAVSNHRLFEIKGVYDVTPCLHIHR